MKVKIVPSNDNLAIAQGYADKVYSTLDFLVNGELNIQHNCTNKSENALEEIITQLFIGSKKLGLVITHQIYALISYKI